MLDSRELEVLSVLNQPMSISDLSEATGIAQSHVSDIITKLVSKGLVRKKREGKQTVVAIEEIEPVNVFQNVVHRHPHVDFPELLHGKTLRVLYYLDSPATVSQIAEQSNEHRNTVHRIIKRLQNRGIVGKNAGTYSLNEGFETLSEFARALGSHYNALEVPVAAWSVIWEELDEFLIQTEAEISDPEFHLTGPRKFSEFGVPLVATSRRHYFYSEYRDQVTPADVVCHALLVDDSARYRGYCLLLVRGAGVEREELQTRAKHYGVEGTVEELLRYLDAHGEGDFERMPAWTDLEQTAADYGIEL